MFLHNRNNFIQKMKPNTAALFYSGKAITKSGDQTFPFEVDHNFYYLTGINQPNTILLLVKTPNLSHTFLFLEENNPSKALWDGDILSFSDAYLISQINLSNLKNILTFETFLFQMINPLRGSFVDSLEGFYFDLSKQTLDQKASWALEYCQKMASLYPFLQVYNSSSFLFSLRQTKSVYEQTQIQKALDINHQALNYLSKNLKPGMYEYQIAALFHYFLENNQTQKSFETIAASGKNALILHYNKPNCQLKPNDLLLFDAGVTYNHYSSDITRCYPVSGQFSSLQKDIYNLVLKANKEIIAWVKPHHTFTQLNQYGKDILLQGLKEMSLLKEGETIHQYCYHGLGHHLGLDIHDVCNYTGVIGTNSVITVEPGLYLKDLGIGVRIEDNLLITQEGAVNLSKHIPKEVKDIEALMKPFVTH
ncbi:aminopeptidase P family protein ['Catharanthus roseus' aster yellows phytoplasma]|uniref:Xaa-Pro aminopeptidase n=1 Tax='Catharanthus roseus' aster yellows phytoplasma TaxID=1193712 RepID=A0A4P6M937_9MOLU|nr:aminopeptidase P family protein ['Catharanthus roseus' aster yellows phytoplasma]QBF23909.1 M24 family metallopeptidase ['Catharanthus roseus' aster yellows phytoplasma]